MKWSAIRNWALTVIAAAGLMGATGVLAERMLERARDDARRQIPADPERVVQPAAELARVAQAQPTTPNATAVSADETRNAAAVRRYIPLVVPGLAILLLVCIVAIWHLAL